MVRRSSSEQESKEEKEKEEQERRQKEEQGSNEVYKNETEKRKEEELVQKAFAEPNDAVKLPEREQEQGSSTSTPQANEGKESEKNGDVGVKVQDKVGKGKERVERIKVNIQRNRPELDPYSAALSDELDLASHHVLTLASKATRMGAATINIGAKSLGIQSLTNDAEMNKIRAKEPHPEHKDNVNQDDGSVHTVAHIPYWAKNFAKRKTREQSYVPLLTFQNPWESFKSPGLWEAWHGGLRWGLPPGYEEGDAKSRYKGGGKHKDDVSKENEELETVNVIPPDFAKGQERKDSARVTWLGHATTLVQFPSGLNVLFDPIFVARASPSQSAGPIRFTEPPCQIDDLPRIDVVCISHNHYDHLSSECMRALREKELRRDQDSLQHREDDDDDDDDNDDEDGDGDDDGSNDRDNEGGRGLKVFCALGNVNFFKDIGFTEEEVIECDWWEEAHVQVNRVPSGQEDLNQEASFRIVCTPAQHGSGRSGGDQGTSLWSSWLLIDGTSTSSSSSSKEQESESSFRVFFAGDTGIRSHDSSRHRSKFPVCPAFEQVSEKYGVPQLLLLPISVGSSLSYFRSWDPFPRRYSPFPRVEAAMTSAIHMDSEDAAECHKVMGQVHSQQARKDVAKKGVTSLAVHYGTFVRNNHQTREDVRALRAACQEKKIAFLRTKDGHYDHKAGGDKGRFLVSHQGETVHVPIV